MDENVRPDDMARITTPELAQAFIDEQVAAIRAQIGDKKVLLALSGGVDSSVVAALLIKAIGKQLICVHVNHGLHAQGRAASRWCDVFQNQMDANLVYVDASRPLPRQAGRRGRARSRSARSSAPSSSACSRKRPASSSDDVSFLAQGTIYPDILESKPTA